MGAAALEKEPQKTPSSALCGDSGKVPSMNLETGPTGHWYLDLGLLSLQN